MSVESVVLMVLNAVSSPLASAFIPATAPKAMRATANEYSTRYLTFLAGHQILEPHVKLEKQIIHLRILLV